MFGSHFCLNPSAHTFYMSAHVRVILFGSYCLFSRFDDALTSWGLAYPGRDSPGAQPPPPSGFSIPRGNTHHQAVSKEGSPLSPELAEISPTISSSTRSAAYPASPLPSQENPGEDERPCFPLLLGLCRALCLLHRDLWHRLLPSRHSSLLSKQILCTF